MRIILSLLAFSVSTPSVAATPYCGWLAPLVGGTEVPEPTALAQRLSFEKCAASQTETGPSFYCMNAFQYRSNTAITRFEGEVASIQDCFPGDAALPAPNGVNHPDTHNVRMFLVDQARITVSLKDKAQHGKSYVFLQVEPNFAK